MAPKGSPTTSAERMRLKRLRDKGVIPPALNCKECGRAMKYGASEESKAYSLGLCWACWKKTDEGKLERRRQNLSRDTWGVCWFGGKPGEDVVKVASLRAAISASYVSRRGPNGTIFIVWSDGRVTEHTGLTIRLSKGLRPEDGVPVTDDPDWFREQVDERLKTWFAS